MFGRLTVYLRRGLFVVGVVLLVWWPISLWNFAWLNIPLPGARGEIGAIAGYGIIALDEDGRGSSIFTARDILAVASSPFWPSWFVISTYGGLKTWLFFIPLWMPAVACLAWPVTSFLLARRRRGRGFGVEGVEGVGRVEGVEEDAPEG